MLVLAFHESFCFSSTFLNRKKGSTSPAISEIIQTINGARIQVVNLVIRDLRDGDGQNRHVVAEVLLASPVNHLLDHQLDGVL